MNRVVFTDLAKFQLQQMLHFYRAAGAAKFARKSRAGIVKKAQRLLSHPMLGQIEPNLEPLGLGHRYLVDGHFKIVYRILPGMVVVTNVFDTRQDPGKML